MNKILAIAILGVTAAVSAFAAPPMTVDVTGSDTVILPARGNDYVAPAWATNTVYAQGDYVTGAANQKYMAIVGGTSSTNASNIPSIAHGLCPTNDGTVIWYKVERGQRQGYVIYNNSTNTLWFSVGDTAVASKGRPVAAGATIEPPAVSTPAMLNATVHAIAGGATTNAVTFQEW